MGWLPRARVPPRPRGVPPESRWEALGSLLPRVAAAAAGADPQALRARRRDRDRRREGPGLRCAPAPPPSRGLARGEALPRDPGVDGALRPPVPRRARPALEALRGTACRTRVRAGRRRASAAPHARDARAQDR